MEFVKQLMSFFSQFFLHNHPPFKYTAHTFAPASFSYQKEKTYAFRFYDLTITPKSMTRVQTHDDERERDHGCIQHAVHLEKPLRVAVAV